MSDSEIVEVHNESLRNEAKQAAEYKHVVFEVPLGSAQIEYFARCDQWVPRSCALRRLIQVAEHGEIIIDPQTIAGSRESDDPAICQATKEHNR